MANVSGVLAVASALVRPGMLRPHLAVACTYPTGLCSARGRRLAQGARLGCALPGLRQGQLLGTSRCLTQTRPYEDGLAPALARSWAQCKQVFGPDNILLVSNSAGTRSDPRGIAAENVSSQLGVPVLLHASKKPARRCARQIVDHFRELVQRGSYVDGIPRVLVVGDRLMTDMVLATRIERLLHAEVRPIDTDVAVDLQAAPGLPLCTSMLTTELWAPEKLGTRLMRRAESGVLQALVRVGIPPGGGWRTRAAVWPPAWEHEPPAPAVPAPPAAAEERPASLLLRAAAAPLPPRLVRLVQGGAHVVSYVARMGPVARILHVMCMAWHAIFTEVFKSVQHTRALTWSTFTAAPTEAWTSTWRKRRPSAPQPGGVPPVGSLRSGKHSRLFSTCAPARTTRRAAHERPVARRAAPTPEAPVRVSGWWGIPARQWFMALVALIILPVGFVGGIKLNDALAAWRGDTDHGDALANEGHAPAMEAFATPAEQRAEAADVAHATASQLSKDIQRLERDHFLLRREREDVQHKLDRLATRHPLDAAPATR